MHDRTDIYTQLATHAWAPLGDTTIERRMLDVVDLLWGALASSGVSWVGFYLDQPDQPDDQRMILGPRRDKPACSPIGLHGVCGQALLTRRTRIIEDVRDLGPDYIACDPRDQSEIVIPLIDPDGRAWAVLDLDSYDLNSFTTTDDRGLRVLLSNAGLNHSA